MIDEISIGPCMVVELAIKGADPQCSTPNAVEQFRLCVGPPDPVRFYLQV